MFHLRTRKHLLRAATAVAFVTLMQPAWASAASSTTQPRTTPSLSWAPAASTAPRTESNANDGARIAADSASAPIGNGSTAAPVYVGHGPVPARATLKASAASCPSGYFCFWNNAGFDDGPGRFVGSNPDWVNFAHSTCPTGTWNDCASSVSNVGTTGLGVEVYQNINYSGASACIPDGYSYSDLANYDYPGTSINMNDTISSNLWTTGC